MAGLIPVQYDRGDVTSASQHGIMGTMRDGGIGFVAYEEWICNHTVDSTTFS